VALLKIEEELKKRALNTKDDEKLFIQNSKQDKGADEDDNELYNQ
jgi:hypothetical protein